jgi:hypothetical protein
MCCIINIQYVERERDNINNYEKSKKSGLQKPGECFMFFGKCGWLSTFTLIKIN